MYLFIYLSVYEGRTGRPGVQAAEFTRHKPRGKRIALAELFKCPAVSSFRTQFRTATV